MAKILIKGRVYFPGHKSAKRKTLWKGEEEEIMIDEYDCPASWWLALYDGTIEKKIGKKLPRRADIDVPCASKSLPIMYNRIYIPGGSDLTGHGKMYTYYPRYEVNPDKEDNWSEKTIRYKRRVLIDNDREYGIKNNVKYWKQQRKLWFKVFG